MGALGNNEIIYILLSYLIYYLNNSTYRKLRYISKQLLKYMLTTVVGTMDSFKTRSISTEQKQWKTVLVVLIIQSFICGGTRDILLCCENKSSKHRASLKIVLWKKQQPESRLVCISTCSALFQIENESHIVSECDSVSLLIFCAIIV